MNKCLYCYRQLGKNEHDFHKACSKRFFGTSQVPQLEYSHQQLDQLAAQIIREQTSLTGVQPKLSLHLNKHEGSRRLTVVGLWGRYICKPQTPQFESLPEIEDLTMHLAQMAHIAVVPHTLIRMADDSLCYLTQRIDRTENGEKVGMEDMCQITQRPTEYKYQGCYERIANAIEQYSAIPRLDVVNFFEIVLFCWITGNNDMHLKNFSIYECDNDTLRLTPAYDLLNVAIVNPEDNEELALTLNGRKRNIARHDFLVAARTMGLPKSIVGHLFKKYARLMPAMCQFIEQSFLSKSLQEAYKTLLADRIARLRS